MAPVAVSVIVVSRGRPDALVLCLTALAQVQYPNFEIVVVADAGGMQAVRAWPGAEHVKCVAFDEANISAARNAGIAAAAGEVVAFIDDDAVPEPSWLQHLVAPFRQSDVAAACGYVRGRNGISYQWRAQALDRQGQTHPLQIDQEQAVVLTPPEGQAIRTEGTNMAFRREVLAGMGGFDPAYRYFHDEADVNMRMALAGLRTAVVPLAEVHHGFHANAIRRQDRAPKDLTEIGASWAVFLNKYCPEPASQTVWRGVQATERRRALHHMVQGALEPRDVGRLMRQLRAGYAQGAARPVSRMQAIGHAAEGFRAVPTLPSGPTKVVAGRLWQARNHRRRARELVQQGHRVTLILLSRTAVWHRIRFQPDGYWEHRGGLFGPSVRGGKLFQFSSFKARIRRELSRISSQRLLE